MEVTQTEPMLAALVRVRPGVRSISLETDLHQPTLADGYVLTEQARVVLGRLLGRFAGAHTTRAWTLTGPYGSGKSYFGLYLMNLLAAQLPAHAAALAALAGEDSVLAAQVQAAGRLETTRGLLPIPVTGYRASIEECIRRGVVAAFKPYADSPEVARLLADYTELHANALRVNGDGRAFLDLLERTRHTAAGLGHSGVVIVLDEMGKTLEHVAAHPDEADVYVLQQIAEAANRSAGAPLLFIGILHQSFDRYAGRLDGTTQREWSKVQGRYEDVAFQEPPVQQMWLLARALELDAAAIPEAVTRQMRADLSAVADTAWRPTTLGPERFVALAERGYPLHPTALVALPYLFRRLAQNERSLFAYLTSHEPFGFQEFLRRPGLGATVRLADLFDYLAANFQGRLYASLRARIITETLERLEQAGDKLDLLERDVLKTVGLVNWLAEVSPLTAAEPELIAALAGPERPSAAVRTALERLRALSLVVFRRFNRTWVVWQGSDVDLEERLGEAARQLSGTFSLAETVGAYLPPRPIVARRHSYQTGTTRFFGARYVDAMTRDATPLDHLAPGASGAVLLCLPANAHEAEQFAAWALAGPPAERPQLVVGVAQRAGRLAELAGELRSLHWVSEHTPELRDDPVARRELRARTAAVESLIGGEIERTLTAGRLAGQGGRWFYRGHEMTAQAGRGLSALLSIVGDELYPQGPLIRNELINRRGLSSQGAAARRNLIEAMLKRGDQPRLGIEGFPPERSMYESVLRAGGLHREAGGRWVFVPPPADDPLRLRPAWEVIEATLFAQPPEPRPVATLFAQLRRPPYGLTDGVLPVLLCACLLAHADAATLYSEGTLLPEPGIADWEVLLRRPELFAVAGSRVTGSRAAVVDRLARGLGVAPAALPVVRDLIRRLRSLPDHAWKTQRLSPRALALRRAVEAARSPEQLLFHDLPAALDVPPFPEVDDAEYETEAFFERLNRALGELAEATPRAIAAARDALLDACGLPAGEAGWRRLRAEAAALAPAAHHPQLVPLLRRAAEPGEAALESALAFVAGRPPKTWTDADATRFADQAAAVGRLYREARLTHLPHADLSPQQQARSQAIAAALRDYLATHFDDDPAVIDAALHSLQHNNGTLGANAPQGEEQTL